MLTYILKREPPPNPWLVAYFVIELSTFIELGARGSAVLGGDADLVMVGGEEVRRRDKMAREG